MVGLAEMGFCGPLAVVNLTIQEAFESAVENGLREIKQYGHSRYLIESVGESLRFLERHSEAMEFLQVCVKKPNIAVSYELIYLSAR